MGDRKMTRRSRSSPFRLDWHGDDLVVLLKDEIVARRKGKRWHLYAPIVVKDEPDGGVTIAKMTSGDLMALLRGKSRSQVGKLMAQMGYVLDKQASFGELYHDAVKRGDPEEIEWL
jgi:hypothetical protein